MTSSTFACDCVGESTVEESVKSADIVAVGTVISKSLVTLTDSEEIKLFHPDTLLYKTFPYSMTIVQYKVVIEQVFKGKKSSDTIIVYTGVGHGDCGYNFVIGDKYIIYGQKETYIGHDFNKFNFPKGEDIYWTDICKRTTLFSDIELNEIKRVTTK